MLKVGRGGDRGLRDGEGREAVEGLEIYVFVRECVCAY